MNDSITTITIMVMLLLASAYFSATEMAFLTMNRTRISSMAEYGNKRAQLVMDLSEDYVQLQDAILLCTNVINIGLASTATLLCVKHFGENIGAGVSTALVALVVLVFGQVSPKKLAKERPEHYAMLSATTLSLFVSAMRPISHLCTMWEQLLSRVFKERDDRKLSHSELLQLVDEVEQEMGMQQPEYEAAAE